MNDMQHTIPLPSEQPVPHRRTIGLLTQNIVEPWELLGWHGCLDAARNADVNLLCVPGRKLYGQEDFEAQAHIVYDLLDVSTLDGLILWIGEEQEEGFCRRYPSVPMVGLEDSIGEGRPSILMDNYQSMRHALIHLITIHGYRRIAFIPGPAYHHGIQERYRAYCDTLVEYGIPVDPKYVHAGRRETLQPEEIATWLLVELSGEIDAVVGHNDYVALLAQNALQSRNIRIPEDIAVVGFDDMARGQISIPALTTVRPPFYQMGQAAVKTLLDVIAGKEVPDEILLHGTMVERESCGCVSPVVVRAAAEQCEKFVTDQSFRETFIARRDMLLAEIGHVLGMADKTILWATQLVDGFGEAMIQRRPERFLEELADVLRQINAVGSPVSVWHDALSLLRCHARPCCVTEGDLFLAENLWQQARVVLSELIKRVEQARALQGERQADRLRKLGARLITTFDVDQLMAILAESLAQLGFPGGYLALYDPPPDAREPQPYSYPQPAPERSRLALAYNEHGTCIQHSDEQRFPSNQLVPPGVRPTDRQYSMVVEPLYFQTHQLGFALFEIGPREGNIYEALREQLSSALQGALLVQHIQERSAELARQKYVLDTFMETVPDSIYFKDRESRIIQANMAHARLLSLHDPAEEIGKTDFDFFPEEEARIRYEQEQEIIRSGQPLINLEEPRTQTGGKKRWALTTKMPLRDEYGEIIGTFGISRDITAMKQVEEELLQYREHLQDLVVQRTSELTRINTLLNDEIAERKRVERALRLSEQQYRMLAENVMEGVAIVQDDQLTFINAVFAAMIGYPAGHLLRRKVLQLFPEHEQANIAEQLSRIDAETTASSWQAEILTREGTVLWVEVSQTQIIWENQPALLLTIRNIHLRKLREQQLEQERERLQQENLTFKSTLTERYKFGDIVGKSPAMQRIYELIINAAASDVNVLVVGESGTGKELIAQTIHQVSPRKRHPFVPVNCASIPESLFEREFFGHRRGAFTGADQNRPGLFDRAHQGTLFLDEVTELTPGTQAKLLRVLQDGEYLPLGSTTPKQADVLIIAATNKDWKTLIKQGLLRKDFFYRVCVIEIRVPPLWERREDIPLLVEHLLDQYRQKQESLHGQLASNFPTDQTMLPGELIRAFYAYQWPGNVRELQNVLQRYLATQDLESVLALLGSVGDSTGSGYSEFPPEGITLSEAVKTFEKRLIAHLLEKNQHHTGKTAEVLGITRRALQYKIKAYGLKG